MKSDSLSPDQQQQILLFNNMQATYSLYLNNPPDRHQQAEVLRKERKELIDKEKMIQTCLAPYEDPPARTGRADARHHEEIELVEEYIPIVHERIRKLANGAKTLYKNRLDDLWAELDALQDYLSRLRLQLDQQEAKDRYDCLAIEAALTTEAAGGRDAHLHLENILKEKVKFHEICHNLEC